MSQTEATTTNTIRTTALHSLHYELGARLVPFAGYEMPVQYTRGIKHEHQHTRNRAGLFDISHMGQLRIYADDIAARLETLVPGDITTLEINRQRYTVLTNEDGGIIDDLMITRGRDHLFLVINAACKDKDISYLKTKLEPDCRLEILEHHSLLALQGPDAVAVMAHYNNDIAQLGFMQGGDFEIDGIPCSINRCGYTGEDGFEISVTADHAPALARKLLTHAAVEPIGLGARDSLRLEAGLCLYGHDIDARTTPIEAGLGWVVAKKYRQQDPDTAGFPGAARILAQMATGTTEIRSGFKPAGRIPVREGAVILNEAGQAVGRITSGGFGPTVGGPVAMGYIHRDLATPGTALMVEIRGKTHTIHNTALPFIKHRYFKS